MGKGGVPVFGVSLSSVKHVTPVWSLLSSAQRKDNRGMEMTKVVLLYGTYLPYSVKTRPWHLRANGLPEPLEELQLLLLTEHRLASCQALELEDEFRVLTPKLMLYLLGHPVEPIGDLLLVSA
jgi:hypothetical protein